MSIIEDILYNKDNRIRVFYRSRLGGGGKFFKRFVIKLLSIFGQKYFAILSTSDFLLRMSLTPREIHKGADELVLDFKFYGLVRSILIPKATRYKSPGVLSFALNNAIVLGRSDVFFKGGFAVFPNGFNPNEHLCNIETFNIGRMDLGRNTLNVTSKPTFRLNKGVSLLGDGAGNYAHYLTEIIPKLIAINSISDFDDFPLIADGWVGERLLDVLNIFNNSRRQVILVNQWERVLVDHLVCVTSPTHAPQDFRSNFGAAAKVKGILEAYKFTSYSLRLVREEALKRCLELGLEPKRFKRIYILRKGEFKEGVQYNIRTIANQEEICRFLLRNGFKIIDTTSLSFSAQVMLFAEAELVVAPVGASLANLIFSNENTKVIALSACYEGADYSYFTKLMSALDHKLSYVVGPQVDYYDKHPMHKNYTICIEALKLAIKEIS